MKRANLEQPNNPRDVMVHKLMSGWFMGRYENGMWRLYFEDTGLKITDNQDYITHWDELPKIPDGLVYPDWYNK